MKLKLTAAFLFIAVCAQAKEYDQENSPEVLQVEYTGTQTVQKKFEIGVSSLTVSVACQPSPEAATAILKDKLGELGVVIKNSIADLKLPESPERLGYDVSKVSEPDAYNPVSNQKDLKKDQFFWTNACTGQQSAKPLVTELVYKANATLTIRFPNDNDVLNKLTALVAEIQKTNTSSVDAPKVTCNSSKGTSYALSVTKGTKDIAWKESEQVAKERALAKQKKDLEVTKYTTIWPLSSKFMQGSSRSNSDFPAIEFTEVDGKTIAKVSEKNDANTVDFNVYVKQPAEGQPDQQLVTTKEYSVKSQASTIKGIYESLAITVSQGCLESREAAESALTKTVNEIHLKLQAINKNQALETDRLDIPPVAAEAYAVSDSYKQVGPDKKEFDVLYNTCSLESYPAETEARDIPLRWQATQQMTIVSSDLKALKELETELHTNFKKTSTQPGSVSVTTNAVKSLSLEAYDQLDNEFKTAATEKFLAADSPFMCERKNYSFACLTKLGGRYRPMMSYGAAAPAPGAGPTPESYNSEDSAVLANERGVEEFTGTYTITILARKDLL